MAEQLIIFGSEQLIWLIPAAGFAFFTVQEQSIKKRMVLFGAMVLPIAYIIAVAVRSFFYSPRPFVESGIAPLIPHAPDNGFPSDHTLLGAAIATALYPFSKKLSAFLWVVTALVGASRVLAGVHHGIDVLASMLIAGGTGFFAYYIAKKFRLW
ncbi:MAG: phosphatase PAP2 family protein [Patescibacteria group bacterium]|nr:phosphatase PAP2 family protein [Patescibacteria group bacterium]